MLRKALMIYLYIHFGFLVPLSCTEESKQQLQLHQKENFIQYGDIQQIIQRQNYTLKNRSDDTKKRRRTIGNEHHLALQQKIQKKRDSVQQKRRSIIEEAVVKQQLEEFVKNHGHLPQTIFIQNEEHLPPSTHFVSIGDLFQSVVNSVESDHRSEVKNKEDQLQKPQVRNDNNVHKYMDSKQINGYQANIITDEHLQQLQQYQYELPIQQQLIQMKKDQLKLPPVQYVNQQTSIENQNLAEQLQTLMMDPMEQNNQNPYEVQMHNIQKLTETQSDQQQELEQRALKVVKKLEQLLEGKHIQLNQGWNSNQQNQWFSHPVVPQNTNPLPNELVTPTLMQTSNVHPMASFWHHQNPIANLHSLNLANLNPMNLNHTDLNPININYGNSNFPNMDPSILNPTNLNQNSWSVTPKVMAENSGVGTILGYISTAIAITQAYLQFEAWEQIYRMDVIVEETERLLAQISSKVGLLFDDADHLHFLKHEYEESHSHFKERGRIIAQIKHKISRMGFLQFQTENILNDVKIELTGSRDGIAVYQRQQITNGIINIILLLLNTVQLFTDSLSWPQGAITGAFVALPVGNAAFCFLVKKYAIIFRDIFHGIIELELQIESISVHLHDTEDWLEFTIGEYGGHIGYHGVYKPTNVNLSNKIPINGSLNFGGFNFSPFGSENPGMGSSNPPAMMMGNSQGMMMGNRPGNRPGMMSGSPPAMMMGSPPAMMIGSPPAMMTGSPPAMMMGSPPAMMMGNSAAQTNQRATIIVL